MIHTRNENATTETAGTEEKLSFTCPYSLTTAMRKFVRNSRFAQLQRIHLILQTQLDFTNLQQAASESQ